MKNLHKYSCIAALLMIIFTSFILIGGGNIKEASETRELIFYEPYTLEIETANVEETKEQETETEAVYEEEVYVEEVAITDEAVVEETFNQNDNAPYIEADADFHYLCQAVRIEIGLGDGEEYYKACYMQAAVALNRVGSWANTLQEVLFMDGQFYGYGYDTWDWSQIGYDNPTLMQAVRDCMNYNDTPSNLVFADSRHNHDGTDNMVFYAEIYGQDFYLSR